MIQRIQTVYLLIVVALMVATLFLPLALLQVGGELFAFDVTGVSSVSVEEPELIYPTWGLLVLSAIIALLAMVIIFLYKNRILQIRMCIFNAILKLSFYGLFGFFMYMLKDQLIGVEVNSIKIALAFPAVALILDYLAIRNIGADEALIRSLERLR